MRLPSKDNLESVVIQNPRPAAGVVSMPRINLQGQQALAQGLENLGEGAMRLAIAKDHSDYLTAKSSLQTKALEIESTLEKDSDYTSYGERYKKALEDFKQKDPSFQKVKSGFFGNAYNAELKSEMDLIEARGYERLANLAARKEADASRVELLETIEKNSQALLATPDETTRADILKTTGELIDSKVERNHISSEDAFKFKRTFAEGYALNRFNTLSAQDQVKALNAKTKGKETYFEPTGNWVDAIPPEKKVVLLDRAKEQMRLDSERYQIQKERAIKLQDYQRKENVIKQINSGADLSSINDEDWLRLSDNDKVMVRQLYMRKQGLGSSNPIEEDTAFYKYQDLYANNPKAMAEVDPLEIEISVSPEKVAQVKKWQTDAFQGVTMPASENKTRQIISTGLAEIGIRGNEKRATPFKTRFYEEISAFKEINGKDPTEKDLEDIKNNLIIKRAFGGTFFNKEKYVYEVDKEDMQDIVVPKDEADKISEEFRKRTGRYPSREEIKKTYSFDISYALPSNEPQSLDQIKNAIEDEKKQRPLLFEGIDINKESEKIKKRYYRDLA